ncbi:MAG: FHA domain-containing protein [Gemmataceae bacterium]|nr:FHA domain-containing protein [Gemmataceae bacterium]MCI0739841.1 FHA domain-containing protein [Gemmataceae bacterium]
MNRPETIVGRRKGCHLRVPAESVSRRHCRIKVWEDVLVVEDLASVNGTFVNGERISKPHILRPGDRLAVGAVAFLVNYHLSPAAIKQLQGDTGYNASAIAVDPNDVPFAEAVALPDSYSEETPLVEGELVEDAAEGIPIEDETLTALEALAEASKSRAKTPKASKKQEKEIAAAEEQNPDASVLLGHGSWQLPESEDIRDILSQLEREK